MQQLMFLVARVFLGHLQTLIKQDVLSPTQAVRIIRFVGIPAIVERQRPTTKIPTVRDQSFPNR